MTLNEWISFGVKNHLIEDSDAIASAITLIHLIGIMTTKRNIELRPP